jgi:hypothetical protein
MLTANLLIGTAARRSRLPRERFSPLAQSGRRKRADQCLPPGQERTSWRRKRKKFEGVGIFLGIAQVLVNTAAFRNVHYSVTILSCDCFWLVTQPASASSLLNKNLPVVSPKTLTTGESYVGGFARA